VELRRLDITLPTPLGTAAEQDEKQFAVPAEVDSIAGTTIDSQFRDAFALDVLPSPSRSIAIVTQAAA